MKAATLDELELFLRSLATDFDVRAPIELLDGTRSIGGLGEGALAIRGGAVPGRPTGVFFPQSGTMFRSAAGGRVDVASPPEKPILLAGLTAEDLDCLDFMDRFFAADFRDDVYFRRRDGSAVVGVTGYCGPNGGFMRIAGGKCDLELVCDGEKFIAVPYSGVGAELEERLVCSVDDADLEALKKVSDALPRDDAKVVGEASRLMTAGKVPNSFWKEIAERCIVCGSCNYVCPTCTCFEVYDRGHEEWIERRRMWDSCQFDGFMREASGHNPMGTEAERTRRRIHHKLVADPRRWGHVTCFLCGRCDDACPTGIGMIAVCREIVARFGSPAP